LKFSAKYSQQEMTLFFCDIMSNEITILLAEDDDGHAELVERNFRRAGLSNQIIRVKDGQEALDKIFAKNEYSNQKPLKSFLLLLDINMPRLDGFQVLKHLKSDNITASLPVIMLTTTEDPQEITRCYQLGCNMYITKPVSYELFIEAIKRLGMMLQIIALPEIID